MATVGFYHLTRTNLERALPALLARTLAAGERAVVRCATEARVAQLDAALWEAEWLPHGAAADGDAALQPVWLTTEDEAPNGGRHLFLVDGPAAARLDQFARVFDLFDGNDAQAVGAARERWKAAKAAGHELAYWRQGPKGWERQG